MRQRLLEIIDRYNKKKYLAVTPNMIKYYQGKIEAYEHSLKLLDEYKEVI